MEWLLVIVLLALSLNCTIQLGGCTGLCSSAYGTASLNKDGAFQFPVYHRKHPCLSSSIHPANIPADASPIIGNHDIHEGKFFMAIGLGTPPVSNLVTVDTGSTLSWVVCKPCQIFCHTTAPEAGAAFDPGKSTTYQRVRCSSRDCTEVQRSLDAPFGCVEHTDTCLYSLRYGSGWSGQYSAGRLGKDKLTLGSGSSIVDGFVFGCNEDDYFNGRESGIIGFGDESFSFFNQVARRTNYSAFSYCFPGDHRDEGFLSIGPYPKYNLRYTHLIPQFGDRQVYSLQQIDMMVDGSRLQIDPSEYARRMLIVDSGTADTFLLAPVFDAFSKAMITAMRAKGFASKTSGGRTCFTPTGGGSAVDSDDLPTVEMKFTRTTLKLPPENVFDGLSSSTGEVCLAFKPDVAGVRDVQILGNKATRSFRVVYDLQARLFGFQPRAC